MPFFKLLFEAVDVLFLFLLVALLLGSSDRSGRVFDFEC